MPPLLVHGSCVMLLKPDRQEEARDPGWHAAVDVHRRLPPSTRKETGDGGAAPHVTARWV